MKLWRFFSFSVSNAVNFSSNWQSIFCWKMSDKRSPPTRASSENYFEVPHITDNLLILNWIKCQTCANASLFVDWCNFMSSPWSKGVFVLSSVFCIESTYKFKYLLNASETLIRAEWMSFNSRSSCSRKLFETSSSPSFFDSNYTRWASSYRRCYMLFNSHQLKQNREQSITYLFQRCSLLLRQEVV